jgi:hypothetical protein
MALRMIVLRPASSTLMDNQPPNEKEAEFGYSVSNRNLFLRCDTDQFAPWRVQEE